MTLSVNVRRVSIIDQRIDDFLGETSLVLFICYSISLVRFADRVFGLKRSTPYTPLFFQIQYKYVAL